MSAIGGAEGLELTAAAIEWGRRRPGTVARLTERDMEILAALEEWRFLTTRMVGLLFWGPGTHPFTVQHRLKVLHDAGYVDRFRPRYAPGAQEWIYRIGAAGFDVLLARGRVRGEAPPRRELSYLGYVEHDLQLVALIIDLAARCSAGTGPLIERMPFDWQGVDRGRIRLEDEERATMGAGAAEPPADHQISLERARPGNLEPDATLVGRHATTGDPVAVLIEYDRTRRPAKQRDRLHRYDWLLTDGWRGSRFAAYAFEPALVFILQAASLLPSFLREADRELTAWIGPKGAPVDRRAYPGREQIAFTSRDRLAAGDWTMLQVPAVPASRRRGERFRPRELLLPLDRYFRSDF